MLRISAVLLPAMLATGCASIVNGQNQSVSVEARTDNGPVVGASCKLSNNKGTWFVTTPGSTTINRSYEDLAVRCDKENHDPGLASVKSSTKGMAFGNILFGGIIGAGVDMSTGAAYDYPGLITVLMGKTTVVAPPSQDPSGAPGQSKAPPSYMVTQPGPAPTPAPPTAPAAPSPGIPASGAAN